MLIDTHVHIFPDALAEKALGKLAASAHKVPSTDGTLSGTLRKMDEWGIDRIWALNIATKAHQVKSVNEFAMSCKSDRIEPFASVFPFSETVREDVRSVIDAGFRGVKLHPEYQRFDVEDERAFPIYEMLEKAGIVVIFHAGYDVAYPGSRLAKPQSIAKIAKAFPRLQIISAHMGGCECNDEALEYEVGLKNIWLDTAYAYEHITVELFNKIVAKHGTDRLLFATDTPWSTPQRELKLLYESCLTSEQIAAVCSQNALSLLP